MVFHHPGEVKVPLLQAFGVGNKMLDRIRLYDSFADILGKLAGAAHGLVVH